MVTTPSSSHSTSGLINQSLLVQNPLFLHPSDGPGTFVVHEKLIGAQNYRSWKRSVEIALSTKRKLGIIRGTVPRSLDDASLQEQWDTCNNLVISWLMNYVSESIAKFIMFIGTAHAIWLQLKTRFALSNDSHKYKLNWETYDTMQASKSVSEYYITLNTQKEEQRLFQFLNGLDDHFSTQRSQLLLNSPLPSVETACALLHKGETKDKCIICGFKWHPPEKCWEKVGYPTWHHKYKQNQKLNGGMKSGNAPVKRTAALDENGDMWWWIIDTGASDHMSPDNNDLDNVHVLKNKQVINLPNGHTSFISKVGNVTLENKLELKNVLIVPSFKFRLLSVSKLTKDSQCFVTFHEQFCVIQDLKTRKVLGLGKKKVGLYYLLNLPLEQIHARLSSMVVYALEDCSLYSFFSNCSVPNNCAFSFAKLPYSLSDSHAKEPFELIHVDIWGPYTYSVFKTFINFAKTQFGKDIKVVRSDNVLEFLKGSLGPLMNSLGIEHQTSCIEGPQQNGRTVITATYLINRFTTVVLKFKTPYEVMLNSEPVYEHLRVFGCLAVASNPSRVADKFKAKEQVSPSSNVLVPELDLTQASNSMPEQTTSSDDSVPEPKFEPVLVPNTPSQPEVTRKSSRVPMQPSWMKDYVTKHHPEANQVFVTPLQTMEDELRALEENNTWEVTSLPIDKKAIPCHWIYKTKLKSDGSLDRKKARLVINSMNGWDTCQMDVFNAFLHGDLTEEMYMQMPQGYVGKGEKVQDTSSTLVCRLKKSLYGLKQAPRQWFAKLSSALLSFGYVQSKADYSLFTKSNKSFFTAVLVYVDDLLITGSSKIEIQNLKSQLSSHIHMKDLGELNYFLGLKICRSEQGIFISQKKYTLDLLIEARLSNAKAYKLPMDSHVKLQADMGTPLPDPEVYRRYIGKLIYITITRPDICYTVQLLSILLAYKLAVQLTAYCDSDWASCPMIRSTTGYCILLGQSPVAWKSKKQGVVSRSSGEAEYRAVALTCCEVTWLISLLKDLGLKDLGPVDLKCDNKAVIYIAANPVFHARTKHIEFDYHYVRDQVKKEKFFHLMFLQNHN
ncbi:retrovirus-related pol polyprotein from transposon TNT 1-94 [Tanacetum coccineum]